MTLLERLKRAVTGTSGHPPAMTDPELVYCTHCERPVGYGDSGDEPVLACDCSSRGLGEDHPDVWESIEGEWVEDSDSE